MNASSSNPVTPNAGESGQEFPLVGKPQSAKANELLAPDVPFEEIQIDSATANQGNRWADFQERDVSPNPPKPKTQPKGETVRADAVGDKKKRATAPAPPEQVDAPKRRRSQAVQSPTNEVPVSTVKLKLRRFRSKETIPFLASLITHTIALIILMSIAVVIGNGSSRTGTIVITQGSASEQSAPTFELQQQSTSSDSSAFDQQREMASSYSGQELSVSSSLPAIGVGEVEVEATDVSQSVNGSALASLNDSSSTPFFMPTGDIFGGYSVDGRSAGKRSELAMQNGGSAATEAAVEAAIIWLVKHQFPNGSWSTIQDHPDCMGKCRFGSIEDGVLGSRNPKSIAATGLALLTMLGAGYTHREGPYRDEVYRALQYLLGAMQNGDPTSEDPRMPGQFSSNTRHMMYEQGIASFALCEAYQMTKDKWLEPGCQRAINFLRSSQAYDGSWGYYPGETGDLSIVGWQMMALRSASASGLEVPVHNIRRIDTFLSSKSLDNNSSYFYRRVREPVPEMTAIGGLMRLMRGWSPTDPRIQKNIQLVVFRGPGPEDDGPELTDVYFNYYATNLLFYAKSGAWPMWNERLKEIYLASQSKEGHEAGSWFAYRNDAEGNGFSTQASDEGLNMIGGRLYTTTMAALTLEVYYRILPIQKDPSKIDFNL